MFKIEDPPNKPILLPTRRLKGNKARLDWIEDALFARKLNFWIAFLLTGAALVWFCDGYLVSRREAEPKVDLLSPETPSIQAAPER